MNDKLHRSRKVPKSILIFLCLATGAIDFSLYRSQAQVIWESSTDAPNKVTSSVIWENLPKSEKYDTTQVNWEVITGSKDQYEPSSKVVWEVIEAQEEEAITTSDGASGSKAKPPSNLKEAEALLDTIPLQSSDFKPLLNLSNGVPTASVLSHEEWRLISSTISPFKYASGTGNQNYSIRIDYGLSDSLQISGFYSEADDPLNKPIIGRDIRPGNFWEVWGAGARLKFLTNKNWSLALNSSLESWTVGSGGSDSFGQNSGDKASPNIFNDSGKRVETQNLIGSISLPLTWYKKKNLQFTFTPGISFLPSSQGEGQGGAGEFYGTNPYLSGGLLWQPIPEIGLTTSIIQPFGNGTNSFNRNLKYSRVPVLTGGLNWHLNPRIALQGQLTNGFGATPATALLTLPSDNSLGYSASFVFTTDAPDTPQPPLSPIQQSLSLGGLTVNTALVPPDSTRLVKIGADTKGNLDTILGFSISNIFHLDFYRSETQGVPQTTAQARKFAGDGAINLRGSGKAVLTSPLRGAPIWSALRISFGRNMDAINNTANGYLFAETPLTWEVNSKIAFNINPKVAWTGAGNLWGFGLGGNIQVAPRWELIPETNIILGSQLKSNNTLGLRWNVRNDVAIEAYGSTASSVLDIGQLLNSEQIRWGSRLIIRF